MITAAALLLIAIANLGVSFAYGNNGYEAFLTACLALMILLHWQIVVLLKAVKNKYNLWIALLSTPVLAFVWLLLFTALMLSLTYVSPGAAAVRAETNWWIVFIGALPYMLPRILSNTKTTIDGASMNLLVTLYSVAIALGAIIGFTSSEGGISSVILVLAVELQVIVAFIYTKTHFVDNVMLSTKRLLDNSFASNQDTVSYIRIFLIGLPLVAPLFLVISLPFIFA